MQLIKATSGATSRASTGEARRDPDVLSGGRCTLRSARVSAGSSLPDPVPAKPSESRLVIMDVATARQ